MKQLLIFSIFLILLASGCVYRSGQYEPVADTYRVQRGDTLSSIAFNVTGDTSNWKLIARMNPHVDPNHLRAGDVLSIPRAIRKPRFGPLHQRGDYKFRRPEPAEDHWRQYPGGERAPRRSYERTRDAHAVAPYDRNNEYQDEEYRDEEQRDSQRPKSPQLRVVPLYPEGDGSGEVQGMGLGAVNTEESY